MSVGGRGLNILDVVIPGSSGDLEKTLDPLGLFLKPDPIPVTPLPPPVNRTNAAVQKARADTIRKEKNRKGRKSTILTSGQGVDDDQLGIIQRPEARNARLLGG